MGEADWAGLLLRWVHFLAGITWIGLLYFFNLINAGFLKSLDGPTKN
ncbi:MAG: urate hydroxylase PuuD, partial [Nitrospirae bacterium]|nr:urate hydroxylase PuuD [Nitrospirota bacterium]